LNVYTILHGLICSEGLTALRGKHGHHNGNSLPPVRKELTGPNQRWCWDISYLSTFEKGLFLYLYLLLDEYSRKAIHWLISWHERALEAKRLIEGGLLSENILDLPEECRPEIINDRGCQMKARPVKEMFDRSFRVKRQKQLQSHIIQRVMQLSAVRPHCRQSGDLTRLGLRIGSS